MEMARGVRLGKLLDVPMLSLERRRTLKTAMAALVLVAVVEPGRSVAQSPSSPVEELVRTLERIEERDPKGDRSPELVEPLQSLTLHYLENGDHSLAAATIDRALQVVRMHYGLYSLEQAPLIRQSIANEEARENHAAVWDMEQELLTLARRNPDDLRAAGIFREIADKRMDALRRYVAGQYPPEIVLGCYYQYVRTRGPRDYCNSGSKGVAVRNLLTDARNYYENAINVIQEHESESGDTLRELEMKVIRANYFYGNEDVPPTRYETGKESLNRLIDYDAQNSEVLQQIDSLVQIADWDLMYSNHEVALDTYRDAYARLREEGVPQESIDELFMPETPTMLPAFVPNPLESRQTPRTIGFVDVEFEINRYGKSRRIDILDTTTNASRSARREIVRLISRGRFRPRTSDGHFERNEPVVVRYYLNE